MLNHIDIVGRFTRDPELRRTDSGKFVTSFTLAVEDDYKPENGEREVDFIDCVVWGGAAEFVAKYFTRGRMAIVSGKLKIRNYTDKEGNKRKNAEVLCSNVYFGDSKPKEEGQNGQPNGGQNGGYQQNGSYQQNTSQQGCEYQQQNAPQQNGGYQQQSGYPQQGGGYQRNGSDQQSSPQRGGYPARQGGGQRQLPF